MQAEYAKRYGPVYKVFDATGTSVVVTSPDLARCASMLATQLRMNSFSLKAYD